MDNVVVGGDREAWFVGLRGCHGHMCVWPYTGLVVSVASLASRTIACPKGGWYRLAQQHLHLCKDKAADRSRLRYLLHFGQMGRGLFCVYIRQSSNPDSRQRDCLLGATLAQTRPSIPCSTSVRSVGRGRNQGQAMN
jgi:hypothetical protein